MLRQLELSLELNQVDLERFYKEGFKPGIAWVTRNIMELSVWTIAQKRMLERFSKMRRGTPSI